MAATIGLLRYGIPDSSILPEDRAMYTIPPMTSLTSVHCPITDFDSSSEVTKGPAGLDVQGFTFIKHKSTIGASSEGDLPDALLESTYYPELEALICQCTGAKVAKVVFTVFRNEIADFEARMTHYVSKDSERGRMLENASPSSIPIVRQGGRPVPLAHVDYTAQGLRDTIRYSRQDIRSAAECAIKAEDAGLPPPRYAVYSVWRALKTVRRDPIALCDWRSIEPSDLTEVCIRVPSEIQREYRLHGSYVNPPQDITKHKWYWRPNMTAEDVLIIKLGDSLASADKSVAEMAPHSAFKLSGTESLEEHRGSRLRYASEHTTAWDYTV